MNKKSKVLIIFLLVLSFFPTVNTANAKSASIDYFIISNAYDDILSTCVYGHYLYILNDTYLQKISLNTSLVVDEIEFALLAEVNEFMRKGPRIYFDASIDAANTIVCIDLATFTELARVYRIKLTPNYSGGDQPHGLENLEYYDCNGHDFWTWAHSNTAESNTGYKNIFRGRYGSEYYEWSFITGLQMCSSESGAIYVRHYQYNATADSVSSDVWNIGNVQPYDRWWYYASIYFDEVANDWVKYESGRTGRGGAGYGPHSGKDNLMSLQHEYEGAWLDATWGEYGVRVNPEVDDGPDYYDAGESLVTLDTHTRTILYSWPTGSWGPKDVRIARFDLTVGFLSYKTVYLLNQTSFYESATWGQMAFTRMEDEDGDLRNWIGYVNATGRYPKAERMSEVGGGSGTASGTIKNEGYDPTYSMVFKARANLVAIFRNSGDNDNLYVCRNLIDRDLLKAGGYTTPIVSSVTITNADVVTDPGAGVNASDIIEYWVFEGMKRYEFEIEYANTTLNKIKQIGIRFTDGADQDHSVWYDKEANSLTVTSPEDGISGWLHSLTQTGTSVTAIFQIMFNNPIPDTSDVYVYARTVSEVADEEIDTDWEAYSAFTFNIYNLGGLSTLTASGTAGRLPGGDIFEIYAADTRTKNIIPIQDFDVRYSPLAPGVQIAGVQIVEAEDEQKLLDELEGWKIFMTSRTETRTIYPTNRLPATGVSGDTSYHSWPFGLLIKSDSTLDQSLMIEKEFFRTIKTADDEIVIAEVWATVANDTKITGQILISDDGYVDDALKNIWTPAPSDSKRIVDFKFYGNGSIRLMDGVSNIYPATYSGMVWANYTFVMNLTAQTYDFYVDKVLNRSAIGFREAASSVGHITFLDTLNPVFPAQLVEFYVDDVWVHTDFDEDYGGLSKATMLFNQLQHWSMDFDFFVEDGLIYAQGASGTPFRVDDDYSNYGYLEFGWDVVLDGTYVNDFLVARVNITDGHISGKNDWIEFNITWYKRGVYVKNDVLYGLFEGYSLFPGSNKDTSGFHWDMWFNRANASTVVGARINTEYYGMSDKSVWWAVWSSKWTPMRSEVSESTVFIDLEDANGVVHSAKDVLLVRSWVSVLRNTQAQFAYKVKNIAGLDFLTAPETMSGIDTPPIRETIVPDVPSGWFGSFIGAIFTSALKRLGNLLMGFGMGFFTLSVDFIDHIFAALGYPALLTTIFGWMDSLFASVPTLVGYGMTLIGQIYLLINTSAGNTLTQVTNIITIWINMYSITMDLLTGVLTPGINLWTDLGLTSFIQIGAILYPFWLLMYGLENGMQAVIDHVNGVLNIGSFFLNFILNVTGFFVSLLTGLIGAIRG